LPIDPSAAAVPDAGVRAQPQRSRFPPGKLVVIGSMSFLLLNGAASSPKSPARKIIGRDGNKERCQP
jgi:hypothetical protein